MCTNKKWSLGWLDAINPQQFSLYPIQLANCRRIEENDAVYIFDEVGSGKTLSSGMMALHYLFNHPDSSKASKKRVLVITTPTLCRTGKNQQYGQFLQDWFEKLPFKKNGFEACIEIRNYHYTSFEEDNRWSPFDLVIIDEAQIFLNKDTRRYRSLTEHIRTKKVIFLSATPIKSGVEDLDTYSKIARILTSNDAIPNLSSLLSVQNANNPGSKELICSKFDENFPVSRYFKKTITDLNEVSTSNSCKKRQPAELIRYGYLNSADNHDRERIFTPREEALCTYIKAHLDEQNRFVVFTRYANVDTSKKSPCSIRSVTYLGKYLERNGFSPFSNEASSDEQPTYAVITGENSCELYKYQLPQGPLPTVLIITYQIGEQGINLPGYNYVINYHISAYPSALEQRYGRIDRIGSSATQADSSAHVCYLLGENYADSNSQNFSHAFLIYAFDILSSLPSRNALLTKEMIEELLNRDYILDSCLEQWRQLLSSSEFPTTLEDLQHLQKLANDAQELDSQNALKEPLSPLDLCDESVLNLVDLILDLELEQKPEESREQYSKRVLQEAKKHWSITPLQKQVLEFWKQESADIGDQVFYKVKDWNYLNEASTEFNFSECFGKVSLEDCTGNVREAYVSFCKELIESYPIPFIRQLMAKKSGQETSILDKMEEELEQDFENGDFEKLFPANGFSERFGNRIETCMRDLSMACKIPVPTKLQNSIPRFDMIDAFVHDLPIFKFFELFCDEIQHVFTVTFSEYNGILIKFPTDYYNQKLLNTAQKSFCLQLNTAFRQKYLNTDVKEKSKFFQPQIIEDKLHIPNWLKLVYEYTNLETAAVKGTLIDNSIFVPVNVNYDSENIFSHFGEYLRAFRQTSVESEKQALHQAILDNYLNLAKEDAAENLEAEKNDIKHHLAELQFQLSSPKDFPISRSIRMLKIMLCGGIVNTHFEADFHDKYSSLSISNYIDNLSYSLNSFQDSADYSLGISNIFAQVIFPLVDTAYNDIHERISSGDMEAINAYPCRKTWFYSNSDIVSTTQRTMYKSLFAYLTFGNACKKNGDFSYRSLCKQYPTLSQLNNITPADQDVWSLGILQELKNCSRGNQTLESQGNHMIDAIWGEKESAKFKQYLDDI